MSVLILRRVVLLVVCLLLSRLVRGFLAAATVGRLYSEANRVGVPGFLCWLHLAVEFDSRLRVRGGRGCWRFTGRT